MKKMILRVLLFGIAVCLSGVAWGQPFSGQLRVALRDEVLCIDSLFPRDKNTTLPGKDINHFGSFQLKFSARHIGELRTKLTMKKQAALVELAKSWQSLAVNMEPPFLGPAQLPPGPYKVFESQIQELVNEEELESLQAAVFRLKMLDVGLPQMLLDQSQPTGRLLALSADEKEELRRRLPILKKRMLSELARVETEYVAEILNVVRDEEKRKVLQGIVNQGTPISDPCPSRLIYTLSLPYLEVERDVKNP